MFPKNNIIAGQFHPLKTCHETIFWANKKKDNKKSD